MDSIIAPSEWRKSGVANPVISARRWREDCRIFARDVCKVNPDGWQDDFFAAMSMIDVPGKPPPQKKLAMKACKGPGKSFALAIAIWWWMMTRWHPNCIALSITDDNLKTNLWPELARIQQRSWALQQAFFHSGEKIVAKKFEKTWFCNARSFPQNADKTQQANTIAGLHGRHPAVFCDEVGDYPDGVVVAAEAIFSSLVDGKPPDGRLVLAGNPTSTSGPLYRVCEKERQFWWVKEITGDPSDPNRASRIDPGWAQNQIDLWGPDNPWVQVNVYGKFPSVQSNKLLGHEEVQAAANRNLDPKLYQQEPLIMALDVARYGDNESVLCKRQGLMAGWRFRTWRETDLMTLADQVTQEVVAAKPAAFFVDGSGLGGGLVDRLRQLGTNVIPVDFGGGPMDARYANRRAEMWWKMAQWLKQGAEIPDDIQLKSELTAPTFQFKEVGKATKFVIESKKEMKERGVASPDKADALALTFAAPVFSPVQHMLQTLGMDGDTYRRVTREKIIGGTEADWDPYGGA